MNNTCKRCKTEFPGDMSFCPSCGTKVELQQDNTPQGKNDNTFIKCSECGKEISADKSFCRYCGAKNGNVDNSKPQNQSAQTKQPDKDAYYAKTGNNTERSLLKKFASKKVIIPASAALLLIIIAAIVLILISSGITTKYGYMKGYIYATPTSDGNVIFMLNNHTRKELDGKLQGTQTSMDGMKAAVLINDHDENDNNYTLYHVTDDVVFISEGVHRFWLSATGNVVVYIKEFDIDSSTAELWYYNGDGNTKITDDFAVSYISSARCVVSPDGSAIVYTTGDDDKQTAVIWDGSKYELGRDITPVAVSNNAEYIYFFRNDSLYVQTGTDGEIREKLGENALNLCFNRDLSQVVYNVDTRAYISVNGGNRLGLSGSVASFIFPSATGTSSGSTLIADIQGYGHNSRSGFLRNDILIADISDFTNTFYRNANDAVIRINEKLETDTIARSTKRVHLSNDGKTLTYMRGDSVFRIDGFVPQPDPIKIVDGDTVDFVATADGKLLYFITTEMEIRHLRGDGSLITISSEFQPISSSNLRNYSNALFSGLFEPTQKPDISDYFDDWNKMHFPFRYAIYGKDTFFYVSDDELYVSNGDRGRRVSRIEGDVEQIFALLQIVAVETYDASGEEYFYYISTDGINFELIYSESRK